jgi:hypothetical protein
LKTRFAGRLQAIACTPVPTAHKAAPLRCPPITSSRFGAAGFEDQSSWVKPRLNKSLFASFSSEKEESSSLFFSEEKNQKTFVHCLAGRSAEGADR